MWYQRTLQDPHESGTPKLSGLGKKLKKWTNVPAKDFVLCQKPRLPNSTEWMLHGAL